MLDFTYPLNEAVNRVNSSVRSFKFQNQEPPQIILKYAKLRIYKCNNQGVVFNHYQMPLQCIML